MEIKTIDNLILALNKFALEKTENSYFDTIRNSQIPEKDWEQYFVFKDDGPARVCISETKEYQLFLSCWEKDQKGPIHDSDSKEVWIHPLYGKLTEERYRLSKSRNELEQVSSVLMDSQSYSYMQKPETIYRYINSYENRSVCLHLYSNPIKEWREYDKKNRQVKLVPHTYDKLVDKYSLKL